MKRIIALMAIMATSTALLMGCSGSSASTSAETADASSEISTASSVTVETEVEESAPLDAAADESVSEESAEQTGLADAVEVSIHASIQHETDSPEWVTNLESAKDESVKQLFVVAGMGMDKTTATVSMHQRDAEGNWKQILSTPAFVGKNGLCLDADHKEGCGQTPIGVYHFNKAFGIAPDPGCAIPYIQVTDDTYWSGDVREGMHYNEMVSLSEYPDLDMENSEHIVDYEEQ